MQRYFLIALISMSGCTTEHAFVPKNLFSDQPTTIGYGSSVERAKRDSESMIPRAFERESPSGAWGCAGADEFPVWNKQKQDSECASNRYYYISPLQPKNETERRRLLTERENLKGDTYIGTGKTLTDAMSDIIAKLPKEAVTDFYSIGCTKDISIDASTGSSYCDRSIEGNQSEITVHTRKPNAPAYLRGQ